VWAQRSQRDGSFSAAWLRRWNLKSGTETPPFYDRIQSTLGYLRYYIVDVAYMPSRGYTEAIRTYKKRLYLTIKMISAAAAPLQEMRTVRLWPRTDWITMWQNLAAATTSEIDTANWYKVIHDIIPTNETLHRIRMSPTNNGKECGRKDTLRRRLTECGEGKATLIQTMTVIARMLQRLLRTSLMNGCCSLNPPQRHLATCGCYRGM